MILKIEIKIMSLHKHKNDMKKNRTHTSNKTTNVQNKNIGHIRRCTRHERGRVPDKSPSSSPTSARKSSSEKSHDTRAG